MTCPECGGFTPMVAENLPILEAQAWDLSVECGHCEEMVNVTVSLAITPTTMDDEHTQGPGDDWDRASGACVCAQCGKLYHDHPLDGPEGFDGKFLNRLCDGRLVKL